jgi:hypothetical protein
MVVMMIQEETKLQSGDCTHIGRKKARNVWTLVASPIYWRIFYIIHIMLVHPHHDILPGRKRGKGKSTSHQ